MSQGYLAIDAFQHCCRETAAFLGIFYAAVAAGVAVAAAEMLKCM